MAGCKPGYIKMGMCDSDYLDRWDVTGANGLVTVCI